ncbi:hypothetical protein ACS0TY_024054 [Phlomoides rotata]
MENLSYYLVLVLPFVFFIIFRYYSSASSLPPSPLALPLIGHLHLIKDSLHLSLTSLSSRYGPILYLRLGCKSFLVVSSPSAVAECFTKNDIIFANRPRSMAADRLSYNYTAFGSISYGDLWRTLRRLSVVEMFSSHSLQKSALIREEEMHKIARVLHRVCRNEGQKVDLNNFISTYSFNIMMRVLAGKSCVGEEDIGSEVGKEAIKRLKETFVPALALGICDYFPVLRWIGYKGLEKNLISLHKKRDDLLQSLIDEMRKKSGVLDGKSKTNLIGTMLSLQVSEPEFYTDSVIKSNLLVLISAGTDTSGVTIEWAMSLLLSHPEELLKLAQEIDEKVGHDHLLNDSDVVKLPYLGCIVNETLRLHPAAPLLLPHYSSQDCVVSGYNIPKDTILLVNAWAMHRDPNLWEEPDKFSPERFQGVDMEREGQKFMPFGIGRRACPGATMALRTISLALGTFVQCFEWKKPLEGVEMGFSANSRVTLHKANPLQAVCIPRNQAAHLLSQL